MTSGDTIVAQATPFGYSGTALIRISGPNSIKILSKLTSIKNFKPRVSTYSKIRSKDGDIIDYALVTSYPAPSSYTGENIAEITPHGNPALISDTIDTICKLGARVAEPGEFTRRAFINGKMDLIQVEGVASLISAKTKEAVRAQQKIISGTLSTKLVKIKNKLVSVLAIIENEIDISEELTQKETKNEITKSLKTIKELANSLLASYEIGRLLFNGVDIVITGKPNVGKSTLFNRLAENNLSIVNKTPGTTRNLIETEVIINGAPVRIVDTAGQRKSGNPIEKEGVARAKKRIETADLVLCVVDNKKDILKLEPSHRSLIIFNKMDLRKKTVQKKSIIHISALTGAGFGGLFKSIKKAIGISSLSTDNIYLSTLRQKNALFRCSVSVCRAIDIAEKEQPDLTTLSYETRDALDSIDALLGKTTADKILNEVFSSFCVGK